MQEIKKIKNKADALSAKTEASVLENPRQKRNPKKNDGAAIDKFGRNNKKQAPAGGNKAIWIFLLLLVILLVVSSAIYYYHFKKSRRPATNSKASMADAIRSAIADQKIATGNFQSSVSPVASIGGQLSQAPTKTSAVISPSDIAVRILNEGAQSGLAGKVKNVLVAQGYAKAEAGNGEISSVAGNFIYYTDEKFKDEANKINQLLTGRRVSSTVGPAQTDEQKSANIVIVLGR